MDVDDHTVYCTTLDVATVATIASPACLCMVFTAMKLQRAEACLSKDIVTERNPSP